MDLSVLQNYSSINNKYILQKQLSRRHYFYYNIVT